MRTGFTDRAGNGTISDQVADIQARADARFEDVAHPVRGARGRVALETGELDAGPYWVSMAQGLIDDVPSCAERLGRIMAEARNIVRDRLTPMLPASREAIS